MAGGFSMAPFSQDLSFEITALEEEKRRAVEKEAGFCRFEGWVSTVDGGALPRKLAFPKKKVMVERCTVVSKMLDVLWGEFVFWFNAYSIG